MGWMGVAIPRGARYGKCWEVDVTLRVHPDLKDNELMRLFDRSTERQWPSDLLDWTEPETWDQTSRAAMTAILTPVYLGEQTAMMGVSVMLPKMLNHNQPEAALCLSGMGMDEARHFRNLNRLFHYWETEPLTTRRLPEMWRYHARLLQSGEPVHWLWGILISDLFANRFYGELADRYGSLLIGRLARRTVRDEARHQAFADRYLQHVLAGSDDALKGELLDLRDGLFRVMEALTVRLQSPLDDMGWSGQTFLDGLHQDTERWVRRLGIGTAVAAHSEGGTEG